MNKNIFLIIGLFTIISIIPVANAQFLIGEPAYQKSIRLTIDQSNNVQVTHEIGSSDNPISVELFEGVIIESITVTNEEGAKKEFGVSNAGDNGAVTIFSPTQDLIIKYNLENVLSFSDNIFTLDIGYPETFGIVFSEKVELIFLNNNIIILGDQKGISVNNGGDVIVQYYSEIPKMTQEVIWEENKFNVEIISDSEIDKFSFDQSSKSISFQVNEKNKFVTIVIPEELLGVTYFVLLNNEQIQYSKYNNDGYVSLSIKPQSIGEITITGTEYSNSVDSDFLPPGKKLETSSNDYLIWIIVGVTVVIIAVFGSMKILKKKN
ncbi:MAG: hypothetical protein CK526_04060 [Thaumarchaeota archaeon]|nr:MAG: hypothetical protein CK526_04060 [Nitrososphaerota archaeon]